MPPKPPPKQRAVQLLRLNRTLNRTAFLLEQFCRLSSEPRFHLTNARRAKSFAGRSLRTFRFQMARRFVEVHRSKGTSCKLHQLQMALAPECQFNSTN